MRALQLRVDGVHQQREKAPRRVATRPAHRRLALTAEALHVRARRDERLRRQRQDECCNAHRCNLSFTLAAPRRGDSVLSALCQSPCSSSAAKPISADTDAAAPAAEVGRLGRRCTDARLERWAAGAGGSVVGGSDGAVSINVPTTIRAARSAASSVVLGDQHAPPKPREVMVSMASSCDGFFKACGGRPVVGCHEGIRPLKVEKPVLLLLRVFRAGALSCSVRSWCRVGAVGGGAHGGALLVDSWRGLPEVVPACAAFHRAAPIGLEHKSANFSPPGDYRRMRPRDHPFRPIPVVREPRVIWTRWRCGQIRNSEATQ